MSATELSSMKGALVSIKGELENATAGLSAEQCRELSHKLNSPITDLDDLINNPARLGGPAPAPAPSVPRRAGQESGQPGSER